MSVDYLEVTISPMPPMTTDWGYEIAPIALSIDGLVHRSRGRRARRAQFYARQRWRRARLIVPQS